MKFSTQIIDDSEPPASAGDWLVGWSALAIFVGILVFIFFNGVFAWNM